MHYLIALGSNLHKLRETPLDILSHAIWLFSREGMDVLGHSDFYRTPAWPPGAGPDFVNAVASVRSDDRPARLVERLERIEAALGREIRARGEARIVDLDLLACDGTVLPDAPTVRGLIDRDPDRSGDVAGPVLPHPRIQDAGYLLVPLLQVAPDWRHPLLHLTVREMHAALGPDALAGIEPVEDMERRQDVAE